MSWFYLAFVLVSTAGMAVLDLRFRLVLVGDDGRRRRSLVVLACGGVAFLVWDLLAIERGFYERGDSPGMTGIEVAAELPIEELFFIGFLCYLTLVLHALVRTALVRTALGQPRRVVATHRAVRR
jgi:lycopene cyclase domain-containing protein